MDFKKFLAQEVKPSFGCTEPGAVALAAAVAGRAHGGKIERIAVRMSVNVFKNGRSVGLPGLPHLRGNAVAAAIGALAGDPSRGLMVLQDVLPSAVTQAQELVAANLLTQEIVEGVPPVWVEAVVSGGGREASCTIAHRHDRVERVVVDGTIVREAPALASASPDALYDEIKAYDMQGLWAMAQNLDEEDRRVLLEGGRMNIAIADAGKDHDWGLGLALLDDCGANVAEQIRRASAGASEVRMSGGDYPVMSSAGSGNHGITAIIPVVVAARALKADDRLLAESLALSHLVCGFLKAHTGRLTPVCGCAVAAGAGASAGIVMLQGGNAGQAERAVVTFVASLLGMLCDGAKETCSLKVGTAAAEAWSAADLALRGGGVRVEQGLAATNLHETGAILAAFSHGIFQKLDTHLAEIMLQRSTTT